MVLDKESYDIEARSAQHLCINFSIEKQNVWETSWANVYVSVDGTMKNDMLYFTG